MIELNITPEQKRALIILFSLCLGLGGFFLVRSTPTAAPEIVPDLVMPLQETVTAKVVINVAGKVTNPGVYKLPIGSRVIDAINLAGNQLKGVDISDINLARVLVDGEQILVGKNISASVRKKISVDNPLDINTATIAQFDQLPGIGPVTAERIVNLRKQLGRFNSIDDLKKVTGLGGAKFLEIKPLLRI